MRLTSRVFLTLSGDHGCSLSHPMDCNAYAVCSGEEVVLIDAGVGVQTGALIENLRNDGIDPERVNTLLLTHGHLDHAGGSRSLQRELKLRVMASSETASALRSGDEEAIGLWSARRAGVYDPSMRLEPCSVDTVLQGTECWRAGEVVIRALHTPGHSDDMLTYLAETPEGLLAFTGDTVFHGGKIALQDLPDCRPAQYTKSLRALAAMPIVGLFPGHGIWSVQRGIDQITKSMHWVDRLLLPPSLF